MTAPLFIIGCPRSGTTLLLDLLAGTRAFGYVSTCGEHRDVNGALNRQNQIYDAPGGDWLYANRPQILAATSRLGPLHQVANRLLPRAIEPWQFWEELIFNFRPEAGDGPADDPSGADLDSLTIVRARNVVSSLLSQQRRDAFLSKYTDFPRVDLMRSIFPDARFVHIRRDGHAVANSYATEIESGRFGTWRDRDWWAQGWTPQAREHWRATGSTKLGFAAHNRNRLLALIEVATADDPGVLNVSYEHLTDAPVETIRQVLSFAEVESRASLDELAKSRRIANTNDRWRTRRLREEAALLDAILAENSYAKEHT